MKPKVLVCIPSGAERTNWVHPILVGNLITMSADTRFDVRVEMTCDKRPHDFMRNFCVKTAREHKADWLLMVDNDQSLWKDFNALDIIAAAGPNKCVIGLPTFQGMDVEACANGRDPFTPNVRTLDNPEQRAAEFESDREFMTVRRVGSGAMFINRRVWEKIPGPWFKWCYDEKSELHETKEALTEDFYFCDLVRQQGFKVWVHRRFIPHWKTCDCTLLGTRIETLTQAARQAGVTTLPAHVNWKA